MKTKQPARIAAAVAALFALPAAHAFQFDMGDSDVKMRWDNTVKYSTMYRLNNPDKGQVAAYAAAGGAADDGENNFKRGIASSRLDLTSEFDITKNNMGARISAAAWYDDIYSHGNDNKTGLSNSTSSPAGQFAAPTVKAVGNNMRLMDAFAYFKGDVGDMPGRITFGRHAVIYGETLMSGANGIAAAQGAVDIVKAASVPGAQVKEFLMPANQVSGSLQLSEAMSVGGYYQFKWEKSPFFAPGSFLSPADFLGDAESFSPVGPFPFANGVPRTADLAPKKDGQWGTQFRFKAADVEYGLYAANYHDKTPSAVYLNLGSNPALVALGASPVDPTCGNTNTNCSITPLSITHVYHQDIRTYGASASTVLGSDNVSIEVSMRENQPLTGGAGLVQTTATLLGGPAFDNKGNPAYAVGKTQHMTLVDIHVIQPNALMKDGGSVATQFDWHRVASVTKNPAAIDYTTTRSASQVTVAFTADYFQVADGLDVAVPIVWSHNLTGRSRVYGAWVEGGGSLDIGVNFTHLNTWKAGLNYHQFIGRHGVGSYDQAQFDRDYVSFNLSRSF